VLRGHDDLLEDEKELADWIIKKRKLMKQQSDLQKKQIINPKYLANLRPRISRKPRKSYKKLV